LPKPELGKEIELATLLSVKLNPLVLAFFPKTVPVGGSTSAISIERPYALATPVDASKNPSAAPVDPSKHTAPTPTAAPATSQNFAQHISTNTPQNLDSTLHDVTPTSRHETPKSCHVIPGSRISDKLDSLIHHAAANFEAATTWENFVDRQHNP